MYLSLAQPSTHDQATACGFWQNEDIEVFNQCGLYVNETQYSENLRERRQDRKNMLLAFEKQHILSEDDKANMLKTIENGSEAPLTIEQKINVYCAKSNSALFLVRLNDVFRQKVLDNTPGTVQEYPNWRIKLSLSVEEIAAAKEFAVMMHLIKENRP